ncbi:SGNH/GDSL hydrolase family protein [Flagellimonas pacifica]|uniref:GDSL-like Lipase/Acylhydrolase family protein n=1 Tax=Flagellimonas pacifica TaxID=1247520 RepID=A0A285MDL6_9FLAO|nr:SGNH/GDSL hydrolase family protein [Allomuricauda parva]SNY94557.1 GDSL-like Lipase/Acylhydrolase family protein [Allomuricauda parva]
MKTMINFNKTTLLLLTLALAFACTNRKELFVDYSNPQIVYSGRIDSSKVKRVDLYWSGSSIKFNFEGESIAALIEDEKGDNYFNIIIDANDPFIFRPDTTKRYHQLASGLSKGRHSIEIFKRTEWDRGKTSFYGFQIEGNAKILPKSSLLKRKIEFYGNSITAGYAIEDLSGKDSPDSTYTNNYLSYAAITARHFDAKYQCICKSGIGITVSWHPLIMPEMYDRLIPTDSTSTWDFSLYKPDIVVVNLFQNDSWLINMPEYEEFKVRFGTEAPDEDEIIAAYQKFIANIRQKYPEAKIICSLGCMDATKEGSKWPGYIEKAVANLNDKAVYTHFMPYIEATAHPSIKDQETMANELINFIEKNIHW